VIEIKFNGEATGWRFAIVIFEGIHKAGKKQFFSP